ncbi:MAG TPA: hypothetical protein VFV55_08290 [Usitatibacteraceae bacterium]|nr:hypothetical protein [Usitatibacteraceae bacterium]
MSASDCDPIPGNRRRFLARAASSAFAVGGLSGFMSRALAKGDIAAIPGVNRLEGTVTVNGRPAIVGMPVTASDKVSTGPGSMTVLVIRDDAFLLRADTTLEFAQSGGALSGMLIRAGRVLSVFGRKPVAIRAGNASIGIRGTGAYLEVEPGKVYFCLCYGEADIDGPGLAAPKNVKTTHHEQPLVLSERAGTMAAVPGPFINHSDDELILLESLVGREPPFVGTYPTKRY